MVTDDGIFRFLSIFAKNREEWVIADLACILSAVTVVPLYETLGKDSIEYILDQTYMRTIVCQGDKIKSIMDLKKDGKIKNVTHVIYLDDVKPFEVDDTEA